MRKIPPAALPALFLVASVNAVAGGAGPLWSGMQDLAFSGIYAQPITLVGGTYEGVPFVEMNRIVAGSAEPACCPTLKVQKRFRLESDRLIEVGSLEQGHLSLADLGGITWRLTHFTRDESIREGVEVTAQFENEDVSGKGGCNQYRAGIEATSPYEFRIGPAMATRMACPAPEMDLGYLTALEGVRQFSFLLGKLALGYQDGDAWHTLLFDAE